eukprot:504257-Lingulodinium_polyedra.AAC.1
MVAGLKTTSVGNLLKTECRGCVKTWKRPMAPIAPRNWATWLFAPPAGPTVPWWWPNCAQNAQTGPI